LDGPRLLLLGVTVHVVAGRTGLQRWKMMSYLGPNIASLYFHALRREFGTGRRDVPVAGGRRYLLEVFACMVDGVVVAV